MEIAIYSDALNTELTGIGNYVYNLINNLVETESTNKYRLINSRNTSQFKNVDEIVIRNPFNRISKTYAWYPYSVIKLRQMSNIDIVHNPSQTPICFRVRQKYIYTVHDLTPLLFSKAHRYGKSLIYRMMFSKSLENADKIIADSENTKKDILQYVNISQDKIVVIYPGVNHRKYHRLTEGDVRHIKEVYSLNYPFILYVGTLEPRKNIPVLIESFYKIKKAGMKHKLVIVGKKGWKYNEIFKAVEKIGLQNEVIFTGYIPTDNLPKFYNAADLFVYPSLYEGFGFPPLEAMACGIPVITSNTSSLPEVVGSAGIMVDPYDVNELADEMYRVLTDDVLKQDMILKGLERAKLFSWEKTATETLRIYNNI